MSDHPDYNDIKRRRAADLVMIASAIVNAVMGDPFKSNPWEERALNSPLDA